MYRLSFFTFAQGFNHPPQGDAYLGSYTLLTPLTATSTPLVLKNELDTTYASLTRWCAVR